MPGIPAQVDEKRYIQNVHVWEFFEAYSNQVKANKLLYELGDENEQGQPLETRLSLKLTEKMQFTASVIKELDSLFLCTIESHLPFLNACLSSTGATTGEKTESAVKDESLGVAVKSADWASSISLPPLPANTLQAVASFVALFDFLQSRLVESEGMERLNHLGIERLNRLKRKIVDTMLRPSAGDDTQASSSSEGAAKQVDGIDPFSSFMQRCRYFLMHDYKRLFTEAHQINIAIVNDASLDVAWSTYQASYDRWFPAAPPKKFLLLFDNSDYIRWQKRQDLIMHIISSESFKEQKQTFQKPVADLFLNQQDVRFLVEPEDAKLSDDYERTNVDDDPIPFMKRFQLFFNTDDKYSPSKKFYRQFLIESLWLLCYLEVNQSKKSTLLTPGHKIKLMILTMPLANSLYKKSDFTKHLSKITSFISVVFRDLFSSGDRQQVDEEVREQVYRISDELLRLFELVTKYCGPLTTDINAIFIRIVRFINYPIKQQLLIKRMPLVYESLSLEGFTDYLLTVSSFVGVKSAGALDRKAINENTTELLRLFNSSLELCEGLQKLNIVNSLIDVVRAICCNLPDADTTTSLEQSTADSKRVNGGLSENSESPLLFQVLLMDADLSDLENETQAEEGELKSSFKGSYHKGEREKNNYKPSLPSSLECHNSPQDCSENESKKQQSNKQRFILERKKREPPRESRDDWNLGNDNFSSTNRSKRVYFTGNRQRRSQSVVNAPRFQGSCRAESPISMNGQLYLHRHNDDACFSMPPKVVPGYIDCESPTVFTRLIQSCLLLADKQECRDLRSQVTSFLATIDITINLNNRVGFIEQLQGNIISEFKKNKLCITLGHYYEFAGHTFKVVSRTDGQDGQELITIFPEGDETVEQINISTEELLVATDATETDLCTGSCVIS